MAVRFHDMIRDSDVCDRKEPSWKALGWRSHSINNDSLMFLSIRRSRRMMHASILKGELRWMLTIERSKSSRQRRAHVSVVFHIRARSDRSHHQRKQRNENRPFPCIDFLPVWHSFPLINLPSGRTWRDELWFTYLVRVYVTRVIFIGRSLRVLEGEGETVRNDRADILPLFAYKNKHVVGRFFFAIEILFLFSPPVDIASVLSFLLRHSIIWQLSQLLVSFDPYFLFSSSLSLVERARIQSFLSVYSMQFFPSSSSSSTRRNEKKGPREEKIFHSSRGWSADLKFTKE